MSTTGTVQAGQGVGRGVVNFETGVRGGALEIEFGGRARSIFCHA
jgi:hypothetical protein